jgi:hypothetical protein
MEKEQLDDQAARADGDEGEAEVLGRRPAPSWR